MTRTRLTIGALDAIVASCGAHLAGEEGEGDLSEIGFDDLERARTWAIEERAERLRAMQKRGAERLGERGGSGGKS